MDNRRQYYSKRNERFFAIIDNGSAPFSYFLLLGYCNVCFFIWLINYFQNSWLKKTTALINLLTQSAITNIPTKINLE